MQFFKKTLFFLPVLLLWIIPWQQNNANTLETDTIVLINEKLRGCDALRYSNPDSAMTICREALRISSEKSFDDGMIRANLFIGILHDINSQYDSALIYYRKSLALSHNAGDTLRIASNNSNIGLTFYNMGNFREAVEYLLNSLGYFEQLNYPIGIASVYNNLGMIYEELGYHPGALDYYFKSLQIRKEIEDVFGIGAALTNIANVYENTDSLDLALDFIDRSILIKDSIDDNFGLAISKTIKASIFIKKQLPSEAREQILKAIELSRMVDSRSQEVSALLVYQEIFMMENQFQKALEINQKALDMAREIGSLKHQAMAYRRLARAWEAMGQTAKAYEFFKKYVNTKDELISRDQINQIFQLELEYEREQRASEIALLNRQAEINSLKIEKQELLISRRNTYIIAITVVFLASLLLAYFYYVQQKNKEKLKLNKALADVQRQVARGAIEAEIKERQRIAEELHDSFGQILSLIKLNLTKIQKISEKNNHQPDPLIEQTVELANRAFVDLRGISHNMSPIMLKTKGLVLSVKDLVDRIEETSAFSISFEVVNMECCFDPVLEFTLFRTIQELLNNVINHAKASEINLQLIKDDDSITVMLEDNGVGFNEKDLESFKGMGLRNTISRVKNLNGELIIDSSPGRGTTVTIIIPYPAND